MKSSVIKRTIVIGGHKTRASLEDAFWEALRDIARDRKETLPGLVASINANRRQGNLSSAIRRFVLGFYRNSTNPRDGSPQAGGPAFNQSVRVRN
jgi:predicted DNA-binding ribbon-helix-helix protein